MIVRDLLSIVIYPYHKQIVILITDHLWKLGIYENIIGAGIQSMITENFVRNG